MRSGGAGLKSGDTAVDDMEDVSDSEFETLLNTQEKGWENKLKESAISKN